MKLGAILACSAMVLSMNSAWAQSVPVPGYVPPVSFNNVPDYADDTRGVFVPSHMQHRLKTEHELANYNVQSFDQPLYAAQGGAGDAYERELNRISAGYLGMDGEVDRVARGAGNYQGGAPFQSGQPYYGGEPGYGYPQGGMGLQPVNAQAPMAAASGYQANTYAPAPQPTVSDMGMGNEIARGATRSKTLDMNNALVNLREERVTVRRALQRMMDQIGGGDWTVVWDLAEQNAGLPDMEISIFAEEPFMNVLNALLARVQSRSGQPLRVIRYDNTQRLVLTDRANGQSTAEKAAPVGVGSTDKADLAVTERVLKDATVSLHYDEIPLVDALENIVNQAGRGQWRLRMYAGLDQVLKPAHVEEPFGLAMERLLKLFNLKYEVFPGGKLIVVTNNMRFGYQGVE